MQVYLKCDRVVYHCTGKKGRVHRMTATTKARQSNIELLRIVSMALIVLHHLVVHGPWNYVAGPTEAIAVNALAIGGKLGVDCFVLITGYFMVNSHFKIRSVLRIAVATWFYSWLFFALASLFMPEAFPSDFNMLEVLFPIVQGEYWFVTTYMGLILFAPALNRMLHAMDDTARQRLVIICMLVLVVVPTVAHRSSIFSTLATFMCCYIIGATIRLQPDRSRISPRPAAFINPIDACRAFRPGVVALISLAFIIASVAGIYYLRTRLGFSVYEVRDFAAADSMPLMFLAVALFLCFERLQIGSIGWVNVVAAGTFGVYLIHVNPQVRELIWQPFAFAAPFPVWQIVLVSIAATIIVYAACTAIDIVRIYVLERPFFRLLERIGARRFDAIDAWFAKIG